MKGPARVFAAYGRVGLLLFSFGLYEHTQWPLSAVFYAATAILAAIVAEQGTGE